MAQVEQIVARSERAAALRALIDQQAHALFDELILQAPVARHDAGETISALTQARPED